VSIIRIGLAQTRNYGDGYEAIFGKQKASGAEKETKTAKASAKKAKAGSKKAKKAKKK
jgi:hypothetical protein